MENRQLWSAIDEWLTNYKKVSVKATTYDRLRVTYELMKHYTLAFTPVDEITCDDIQRYLNRLATDGYSISTIKKQFNLITGYWKHALGKGLVPHPVYIGVTLPNENHVKPQRAVEAYTPFEQNRLLPRLKTLERHQYGAAILMLEAGLRIGEVLALTWNDILWNRRALTVRKTLVRLSYESGKTFVQDSPKSRASKRTIPLSALAMETLNRLSENARNSNDYIFPSSIKPGAPASYSSVEFHIRKLCKDTGVPYKGLHAFRHTFATNCYERGCDVKLLSKLLGHSDVAVTYNIYIHLYGDALEEMRKVIG